MALTHRRRAFARRLCSPTRPFRCHSKNSPVHGLAWHPPVPLNTALTAIKLSCLRVEIAGCTQSNPHGRQGPPRLWVPNSQIGPKKQQRRAAYSSPPSCGSQNIIRSVLVLNRDLGRVVLALLFLAPTRQCKATAKSWQSCVPCRACRVNQDDATEAIGEQARRAPPPRIWRVHTGAQHCALPPFFFPRAEGMPLTFAFSWHDVALGCAKAAISHTADTDSNESDGPTVPIRAATSFAQLPRMYVSTAHTTDCSSQRKTLWGLGVTMRDPRVLLCFHF